jgi:hypothetical protein
MGLDVHALEARLEAAAAVAVKWTLARRGLAARDEVHREPRELLVGRAAAAGPKRVDGAAVAVGAQERLQPALLARALRDVGVQLFWGGGGRAVGGGRGAAGAGRGPGAGVGRVCAARRRSGRATSRPPRRRLTHAGVVRATRHGLERGRRSGGASRRGGDLDCGGGARQRERPGGRAEPPPGRDHGAGRDRGRPGAARPWGGGGPGGGRGRVREGATEPGSGARSTAWYSGDAPDQVRAPLARPRPRPRCRHAGGGLACRPCPRRLRARKKSRRRAPVSSVYKAGRGFCSVGFGSQKRACTTGLAARRAPRAPRGAPSGAEAAGRAGGHGVRARRRPGLAAPNGGIKCGRVAAGGAPRQGSAPAGPSRRSKGRCGAWPVRCRGRRARARAMRAARAGCGRERRALEGVAFPQRMCRGQCGRLRPTHAAGGGHGVLVGQRRFNTGGLKPGGAPPTRGGGGVPRGRNRR